MQARLQSIHNIVWWAGLVGLLASMGCAGPLPQGMAAQEKQGDAPVEPAQTDTDRLYVGTAVTNVTVANTDPLTTLRYEMDIAVVLGAPISVLTETGEVAVEKNPFHLYILPASFTLGEVVAGQMWMNSAIEYPSPSGSGQSMLLQFWELSQAGEMVTGALANNHAGLGLETINALVTPRETAPGVMGPQATGLSTGAMLQGTVNDAQVTLNIHGNVVTGDRTFTTLITATRQPW